MTDLQPLALIALLAPLAAFFLALVVFRKQPVLAIAAVLLSGLVTAASTVVLLISRDDGANAFVRPWIHARGVDLEVGYLLDGKTLIMGAVVGLITLCVQVYSLSYMASDPGRGRFFAFLALFEWAMLSFVYSPSLMQTFVFWELVGLASFFLIGFWHQKPSAIAAAKKAFLMTRIGDVGLFIGLLLLFGDTQTLSISALESQTLARPELICGLLFIGIVGKSAQFPLHTWLPDAMEGPTPVSALLHSATMVAAGVFLFARFHSLFLQAEMLLGVVLIVAAITALLSSTMAMATMDMKRVLAYSSISQLGFMLLALGAGNLHAGFFHLTTHAFFKALLFLCAGAFIHHFHSNDMVALGRAGARGQRLPTLGLYIGAAALAGLPPLAGFWSKELIIGSLSAQPVILACAYAASFLTAYYSFRMVFLLTRPRKDSEARVSEAAHPHDDEHHAPSWPLQLPIALLSGAAVIAGFFGDSIAEALGQEVHHPDLLAMAPAIAVAMAGVAVAWVDFGSSKARQLGVLAKAPALQHLFANGWYIDALYRTLFVRPFLAIASLFFTVEGRGFDGGSDGIAHATLRSGGLSARAQSGRLQLYIASAVFVMAGLLAWMSLELFGLELL